MSLLTPWAALLAAAIVLPLFLALYILRLRRARQVIPSTLLWRQVTRDLEVNAPIRRLRTSLLFFVQLLLLALLIAAIGEPALRGEGDMSQRLVILIDRSASMNAVPAPGSDGEGETRLDHAKRLAIGVIENMAGRRERGMAAILAFGANADVIQSFSTSREMLIDAIASIEPTDEEADFAAALGLASSFTATADESGAAATELVIFSDGGVARANEAGEAKVTAASVRFVQASASGRGSADAANLGVVTISARRDADNPARCIVFARLMSTFAELVDANVTLRRDGEVEDIRSVTVPPATDEAPGEASLTFALDAPDGALITLAHDQQDVLSADDVASLVIPAPRRPRIALVHAGAAPDPSVLQLLEAIEPETLRVMSEADHAAPAHGTIDAELDYDLIVFDRMTGYALPGVPSISIGGVPEGASRRAADENRGQRILSWDRQHPLLRHVSLDTLVFAGVEAIELPEGAEVLARGRSGPIMAALHAGGVRHVLVGFALNRSNWPRELSIALFMQNSLEYLWLGRSSDAGLAFRPGEPITVRTLPGAEELVIEGPLEARLRVEPGASAVLPALRRAGVYSVKGAAPPMNVVAVALQSDLESDVRVKDAITVNARPAMAGPIVDVVPQPIWTWVMLAALALVVGEWLLFLALKRV